VTNETVKELLQWQHDVIREDIKEATERIQEAQRTQSMGRETLIALAAKLTEVVNAANKLGIELEMPK